MTSVITLSDSDDSDDLPSFADRVKQLIHANDKETNRYSPPKQNVPHIHCISDSEDSRDTIPFNRDKSVSPVCSSPEFTKFLTDKKNENQKFGDFRTDTNKDDFNDTSLSVDYKFNIQKWNSNVKDGSVNSDDDDLPSLNYMNTSPLDSVPHVIDSNSNMRNDSLSSNDDTPIKKKTKNNEEKKQYKEAEKEMKKKVRLEKKKEQELMKALKASEKEVMKKQKPEECLKIVLDHNLLYLDGCQSVLNFLDQNNLMYSIEENNCKYSVNWYRKVINISTENHEILREEREELTDTLVIMISNDDFLKMLHAYVQKAQGRSSDNLSLTEFVVNMKSLYPDSNITCVTVGFPKYMRNIKEGGSFELKAIAKKVHKNALEEAVIELQLQTSINFKSLDDMSEFGSLLHYFTKSVAEAPQRREKQMQKSLAFSWYADSDSHCPIKLSKDGSSFIKLWRQQVQQFQNVGPEVAEAIVSKYPLPRLLLKAYKRCSTTKDAENLLQDIVVRRNYGPLGTQKRIGPELSFKLYLFLTSRDGSKLLKR